MVCTWNELPEEVIEGGTILTFERYLDMDIERKGLKGMGQTQTNGTTSVGQHGQHGQVRLKSLVPICWAL